MLLLLLATVALACAPKPTTPSQLKVVAGVLDLSRWDFNKNPIVDLSGEWDVEVLKERKWPTFAAGERIDFPAYWGDTKHAVRFSPNGVLSYRAKFAMPKTERSLSINVPLIYCAYELYVNGKLLTSNGKVGFTRDEEVAAIRWQYVILPNNLQQIEIVLIHSAFNYRAGGIWEPFEIGTTEFIANRPDEKTMMDFFIFGYLFGTMLYHLVLFALRPKEKSTLFFSILCVGVILRVLVSSEFNTLKVFPNLSFATLLRLDYLSMPIFIFSGTMYFQSLFPKSMWRHGVWACITLAVIISALILFSPPHLFSHALEYMEGSLMITFLLCIGGLAHAVRSGYPGGKALLIGAFILLFGFIFDVLVIHGILHTWHISGITFCLFFFSQAILISMRFSAAFKRSEELGENLIAINAAYSRFVPKTFLENLGYIDITQVKLGDQVQKEMTILFSDIRSFTSLSESMSPQENFNFLNSYLKRMSPIIQQNHGFIDKYIGDAIMALFPKTGEDGLRSAVGMVSELLLYNAHRAKVNYPPVEIGVGLHTGKLILGTIGSDDRMDGTVISDSVNLASRIEGLTKFYGASIVISETTFASISDPTLYEYRLLDRVVVKGKSKPITVYEIFNGLPQAKVDLRLKTKSNFESGINYYMMKEFREAETRFRLVMLDSPDDKAAAIYLERCMYYRS